MPPPIEGVGSFRLPPQLAAGLDEAVLMPHFNPLPLAVPELEVPLLPRPLPQLTVFVRRNAPPAPPPDRASPIRCHKLLLPHFAIAIPPILSVSISKLMLGMDKKETEPNDDRDPLRPMIDAAHFIAPFQPLVDCGCLALPIPLHYWIREYCSAGYGNER